MAESRSEQLGTVGVAAGCTIVAVVIGFIAVEWFTLRWTIVGVLALSALAMLLVVWRTRRVAPAATCTRCGRPAREGLYCAFCGAQHVIASRRVLDDVSIEISDGVTSVLIPYGTPLPFTTTEVFSTAKDSQPSVLVHLVTGTEGAPLRKTIATLSARLLRLRPRKVPQISITVNVDEGGALELEITEVGTTNTVRGAGYSIPVTEPPTISSVADPN